MKQSVRGAGPGTETDGGTALRPLTPRLCHRVRAEDTFTVGWRPTGDPHRFRVAAAWPAGHPFFAPVHGRVHDPLLVVETLRQSTMALLHDAFAVPLTHKILLSEIAFTFEAGGLDAGEGVVEAEIETRFTELVHKGGTLSEARVEWTVHRGGAAVATGSSHARFTSPPVYRRLRGGRVEPGESIPGPRTVRAPAALVGRRREGDVLLAPAGGDGRWELVVDTRHPTLFQRPNDHIPGMLFLEAARQAATAAASPAPFVPSSGSIAFERYAEFGAPCLLEVRHDGGTGAFRVTGHQDGERLFVCAFTGGAGAR
ncbi:ScbA/BarX family gamma-butyrolactone biosynthesis protein [Streptomyces vilmorinianum]|uniref:ScbA/BarX family gamma-butyrolactone biosynthesis protein n=1 Tax=Streptomyces vilmorinianum TaxID=3051092 RepID=UPI0010FB806D|nr:ScbA/BarX family gamma-butyrolactone biosynthesis protein [Streptomyces vilmorinianum]